MPDPQQSEDSPKSVFAITETSYVEHMWFVGGLPEMDFMALLYRDTPEGPWRITYRFRYYNSPDAWDGKDKKRLFDIKLSSNDEDRDKLKDAIDKATTAMADSEDAVAHSIPIKGGQDKFIQILSMQSFAHVKVAKDAKGVH